MYASTQEFCNRENCMDGFKSIDCIFHLDFIEAFLCIQWQNYISSIEIETHVYIAYTDTQRNALIFLNIYIFF